MLPGQQSNPGPLTYKSGARKLGNKESQTQMSSSKDLNLSLTL